MPDEGVLLPDIHSMKDAFSIELPQQDLLLFRVGGNLKPDVLSLVFLR